jgi:trans-aconitate 2-methyltransferase
MWQPEQYDLFKEIRSQPFFDLLEMIKIKPSMSMIDLGCGDGQLTKVLVDRLKPLHAEGIDSSLEMLGKSQDKEIIFRHQKIEDFCSESSKYDLIFSNACLQWLPVHSSLFKNLRDKLKIHGQIAFQIPANFDYPTHTLAYDIAESMGKKGYLAPVLSPEGYAEILYQLNFKEQQVILKVYPTVLKSTEDILEWVKGSLFSYYRNIFTQEEYQEFLERYQKKLLAYFGDQKPFFMPFKRTLIWARL